jgi:hypothetical protein
MAKDIQQFEKELFDESDGSRFSRMIEQFKKEFETETLPVLKRYVREGKIVHWRNFLLPDIIDLIDDNDNTHSEFFEWALTQKELAYWSVDGMLKSAGRNAYGPLTAMAANDSTPLQLRAKIIKSLALHSKQAFDRELPKDPGYWKKEDLRLEELRSWQENGFPKGA